MKIRIKGNFIRYRLTKTEVETLAETGVLAETTRFGPADEHVFAYTLEVRDGIEGLQAAFDGRTITLYMPAATARTWAEDQRVGFEQDVAVAPGVTLKLLLEKDFVCLDDTVEDQSDNYPNPRLLA